MEDKLGVVNVVDVLSADPPDGLLNHATDEVELATSVTVPLPQRATLKAEVFPEPIVACTGTRLLVQF